MTASVSCATRRWFCCSMVARIWPDCSASVVVGGVEITDVLFGLVAVVEHLGRLFAERHAGFLNKRHSILRRIRDGVALTHEGVVAFFKPRQGLLDIAVGGFVRDGELFIERRQLLHRFAGSGGDLRGLRFQLRGAVADQAELLRQGGSESIRLGLCLGRCLFETLRAAVEFLGRCVGNFVVMRGDAIEQRVGGIGALFERFADGEELLFGARKIVAEIVGLLLQDRTDLAGFVLQGAGDDLHLRAGALRILQELVRLLADTGGGLLQGGDGLRGMIAKPADFTLQTVGHGAELIERLARGVFLRRAHRDEAGVELFDRGDILADDAAKFFADTANAAGELLHAIDLFLQAFAVAVHGLHALRGAGVDFLDNRLDRGDRLGGEALQPLIGGVELVLRFGEERHKTGSLLAQALFGGGGFGLSLHDGFLQHGFGGTGLRGKLAFLTAEGFRGNAEGTNAHLRGFVEAADQLLVLIDGAVEILHQRFADGFGRLARGEQAFKHMLQILQRGGGAVFHILSRLLRGGAERFELRKLGGDFGR